MNALAPASSAWSALSGEETAGWWSFQPEEAADGIAPRPLLIIHSSENHLRWPAEASSLHERARDPKRLIFLDGVGHTEWMYDGNATFQQLVAELGRFFSSNL